MPILVRPEEMSVHHREEGWTEITLADTQTIGTPAMVARRWSLEPHALGPKKTQGESEQLLYVIRGSGAALIEGQHLPLEAETVLWLEPGDQYQIEAGENGLEILQGYAPGE
jgi:quercetin dioxygenase-like cupin family protein